ncbi:MAG TPA: 3-alpha domain-containing protein [Vicinamibacterales bacterium]|nr:3-alpha domain-containing protein [Vicinamibacterales bacterium]
MSSAPVLTSIQVGLPQTIAGEPPWLTSIYKAPVEGSIWLRREHLDGDQQADLRVHGGPDKAVCVYAIEHFALIERPHPEWTIQRINELSYAHDAPAELRRALAKCPALADAWRESLATEDSRRRVDDPDLPLHRSSTSVSSPR